MNYAVCLSELEEKTSIKRLAIQNFVLKITESIENKENFDIDIIGIGPSSMNIRMFKSTQDDLSLRNETFKALMSISKQFSGGVQKINTIDAMKTTGFSLIQLINFLSLLQSQGEMSYESKDESIFLSVSKTPDSLASTISYLKSYNEAIIDQKITKVFSLYS